MFNITALDVYPTNKLVITQKWFVGCNEKEIVDTKSKLTCQSKNVKNIFKKFVPNIQYSCNSKCARKSPL